MQETPGSPNRQQCVYIKWYHVGGILMMLWYLDKSPMVETKVTIEFNPNTSVAWHQCIMMSLLGHVLNDISTLLQLQLGLLPASGKSPPYPSPVARRDLVTLLLPTSRYGVGWGHLPQRRASTEQILEYIPDYLLCIQWQAYYRKKEHLRIKPWTQYLPRRTLFLFSEVSSGNPKESLLKLPVV